MGPGLIVEWAVASSDARRREEEEIERILAKQVAEEEARRAKEIEKVKKQNESNQKKYFPNPHCILIYIFLAMPKTLRNGKKLANEMK